MSLLPGVAHVTSVHISLGQTCHMARFAAGGREIGSSLRRAVAHGFTTVYARIKVKPANLN